MVQTWIIAGGATRAPWTDPAANSASPSAGLAAPIASTQFRIMARFTGSRPWRGLLWPAAATRSAASRISSAAPVPAAASLVAVISVPSARYPGQPEPEGRDELPLDLVDPAAEGQHEVAFRLNVQPPGQLGGRLVGRVAVPPDDLRQELAEALQPLRCEHLGRGRVGDVHRLRRRDLPVQQLVDAQAG